ncbi:MAG: FkbM family methyltransferase [Synergistaceae bacterium]|jgi:ribosomal protein S11|nr:FkbM family methyltransferase [Synergistaceae bacterium]
MSIGTLQKKLARETKRVLTHLRDWATGDAYRWDWLVAFRLWLLSAISGKARTWSETRHAVEAAHFYEKFMRQDGVLHIGEVRFPKLEVDDALMLSRIIIHETFEVYLKHDDCYDERVTDFKALPDVPYCLQNDLVDVTVKPGDIVIDAGAWIGDFSAYASVKGATVYAFEPAARTYALLLKTAELNKNIHAVNKGLGDAESTAIMSLNGTTRGNSGANRVEREIRSA